MNATSESDNQAPRHDAVCNKNYEITKVLLSATPPLTLSNSVKSGARDKIRAMLGIVDDINSVENGDGNEMGF